MQRICTNCSAEFEITEEDLAFYNKVSPEFGGKKYRIPPPTHCPMCRLQRRLIYRNQIFTFKRANSNTGESIFSMFSDEVQFPVIPNEEWWGDSWDAGDYAKDYDFERPFFEQFTELRNQVPHRALSVIQAENSDYCNNCTRIQNCYLVFNTNMCEDCYDSENLVESKDCIDCSRCPGSELCYDCVVCAKCYNVQSSEYCEDCTDSFFLLNCRSCKHCFGCVNLRHKEYCIFNKQHTKEEYEKKIAELSLDSYSARMEISKRVEEFWLRHPRPHAVQLHAEDVSGNFLFQSKDVHESTFILDGENLRYCFNLDKQIKNCYDFSFFGLGAELLYECAQSGINSVSMRFCFDCWQGNSNLLYCWMCANCEDCFGCACLKKKQYCILNKQYSKEEYEELVPKIIEHHNCPK